MRETCSYAKEWQGVKHRRLSLAGGEEDEEPSSEGGEDNKDTLEEGSMLPRREVHPTVLCPDDKSCAPIAVAAKLAVPIPSYWDDDEARRFINPKGDETPLQAVRRRMVDLKCILDDPTEYRFICEGGDSEQGWESEGGEPDPREMEIVHKQCMCVYQMYRVGLAGRDGASPDGGTWKQCTKKALQAMEEFGLKPPSIITAMKWHQFYRDHERFPSPMTKRIFRDPEIFLAFPEWKAEFYNYCMDNLGNLGVERLALHVTEVLVPKYHGKFCKEEDVKMTKKTFLELFRIDHLSPSTMLYWMKRLGFRWCPRKKCYFCDGHERADNVKARMEFIREYLHMEERCYRWAHMTWADADAFVQKHNILLMK